MSNASPATEPTTYQGGCHCGAVRFQVAIAKHEAIDCNCSICRKKGFLHLIVPPESFVLLQGKEALHTYRFNTGTAEHFFCKHCGIHPFYRPRSHPNDYDVNLRCLDGEVGDRFTIVAFDGQNWEANVEKLRS